MASDAGYGIVPVPWASDRRGPDAVDSDELTERLGCTELGVAAHWIPGGESLELSAGREQIVVPLDPVDSPAAHGERSRSGQRVRRVPADLPWTVEAEADGVIIVVTTPAEGGTADPVSLDLDDVPFRDPSTSDVATAHLTSVLGCAGCKANARRLEPGQAVPLHTEGAQEELFVPLHDGGSMRVGDETIATPRGTVVRVAPATPRSAQTHGDASTVWLMFGAPPTGGPTDWDPGATTVERTETASTVDTDATER